MDVVIQQNRSNGHTISKYQFKILSSLSGSSIGEAVQEMHHFTAQESPVERRKESSNSSKDELIESLMKKANFKGGLTH